MWLICSVIFQRLLDFHFKLLGADTTTSGKIRTRLKIYPENAVL